MSDNEEPVTVTEQDGTDQIIDLDDVEGHGLREVAAGLGAAAVLAGGGTAAAATIGVHPSAPDAPQLPTVQSVVQAGDRLVDGGVNDVRSQRDATLGAAGTTAAGASTTAARVTAGAEATTEAMVDATGTIAGNVVRGTAAYADRAADGAVSTTRAVVQSGSTLASSTAATAGSTATGTADDATRKLATVTQLTIQQAGALVTSIRINVSDVTPSAGAGATASDMSGFVSIDLGGGNIMRVELEDGQASIDLNTKDLLGKVLNATYSGDSMHASSSRALSF